MLRLPARHPQAFRPPHPKQAKIRRVTSAEMDVDQVRTWAAGSRELEAAVDLLARTDPLDRYAAQAGDLLASSWFVDFDAAALDVWPGGTLEPADVAVVAVAVSLVGAGRRPPASSIISVTERVATTRGRAPACARADDPVWCAGSQTRPDGSYPVIVRPAEAVRRAPVADRVRDARVLGTLSWKIPLGASRAG